MPLPVTANGDSKRAAKTDDDDDRIEVVSGPVADDSPSSNGGTKRNAVALNGVSRPVKKSKPDNVEVVEIDDD